ncbi:hypothetical protein E2C01_089713 [Portunus trituberculatus]|uniref:Uncharacterized protein n=1 Tax=Portunus trituberculatus TaxID=210409 RepID=A0A5B7JCS3_PORTR|nr:hypothetical protein [Portunus trituberculatus]
MPPGFVVCAGVCDGVKCHVYGSECIMGYPMCTTACDKEWRVHEED